MKKKNSFTTYTQKRRLDGHALRTTPQGASPSSLEKLCFSVPWKSPISMASSATILSCTYHLLWFVAHRHFLSPSLRSGKENLDQKKKSLAFFGLLPTDIFFRLPCGQAKKISTKRKNHSHSLVCCPHL